MSSTSQPEKLFKEAKKLLDDGIEGNKKAAKSANEKIKQIRGSQPGNALYEAYYGASVALLARDAARLSEKEELALEGLDALNNAVAGDPDHKEIRMLRAGVCLKLPDDYFQTLETAIGDYVYLLDRMSRQRDYLSAKQAREVLGKLAQAYREAGKTAQAQETERRLADWKK